MTTPDLPLKLDRAFLHVSGGDAKGLLQGLITADVETLGVGGSRYAALLTPQGKILFDFFVLCLNDAYLIDCPPQAADPLKLRLKMYILRSDVAVETVSDDWRVISYPGDQPPDNPDAILVPDPRSAQLGFRAYHHGAALIDHDDQPKYDEWMTRMGVPQFGINFETASVFPHDVGMDQLGGVDFAKGCFVGQEVISRMKHRGTARRRPVLVRATQPLSVGSPVTADGKAAGDVSSVAGCDGLAIARVDRLTGSDGRMLAVQAGDIAVQVAAPPWAGWAVNPSE